MRIGIIGSGSLGSLFAAFLSPHTDLVMLAHWPEQITRLKEEGLTLIQLNGQKSRVGFPVFEDPSIAYPVDLALILVKSYQTQQAAQDAYDMLDEGGIAVTLQNGLGNLEILSSILGTNRVIQGVTSIGANMIEAGVVRHAGWGSISFAHSKNHQNKMEILSRLLTAAGLESHFVENLDSLLWGKLAVNSAINPLTALLMVPNGFLASNNLAKQLTYAAAEETAQVAKSLGIILPFNSAGERAVEVAAATAQNWSSMLQDIKRGAQTEIDSICGQVVKYGQLMGVETPINKEFWRLVKERKNIENAVPNRSKIEPLQELLEKRQKVNDSHRQN